MTAEEILERVGEQIGIRRVFGEPVEHDGVVLVPVAVAIGGGGGGSGADEQGSGGGFGGIVRGIGAFSISNHHVRFIPTIDTTALAAMGLVAVGLLARTMRQQRG